MEDAFKHFDKDGCGSITEEGFSTGLREMGVFQEFSQEEVDQVCAGGVDPFTDWASNGKTLEIDNFSRIVDLFRCQYSYTMLSRD